MKTSLLAIAFVISLGGPAWGQANLAPDPMPRVPAGPGAVAQEDALFLSAATALSRIEAQLGQVAGKAANSDVQQLGARIAQGHETLGGELAKLAKERNLDLSKPQLSVPDQGGPGGAASAVTDRAHTSGERAQQALQRLSSLQGQALDHAYVQEQLVLHDHLVDLYQTEASNTPDPALASFAIRSLVGIQRDRDALIDMAGQFGIAAERGGQPPQYGTAAPQQR